MMKQNSLAQLAIDAAGGLDRWRRFETASARLLTGGVLWPLKQQRGVLDGVRVRVGLRKAWASHRPFGAADLRTSFQPHRVAIETAEGRTAEELLRPRDSFEGHALDTPWSRLQLAYFAGYAMWTYMKRVLGDSRADQPKSVRTPGGWDAGPGAFDSLHRSERGRV